MGENPKYIMYTGEVSGRLTLGHIKHTAREARHSIASMFTAFDSAAKWKLARKEGWKVVRILVQKHDPNLIG